MPMHMTGKVLQPHDGRNVFDNTEFPLYTTLSFNQSIKKVELIQVHILNA